MEGFNLFPYREVNLMDKLIMVWEFLKGKKTFITGLLMISLGILQKNDSLILEGIGLMTLRHAIK